MKHAMGLVVVMMVAGCASTRQDALTLRVTDTAGNTTELSQAYVREGTGQEGTFRVHDGMGMLRIPWRRISRVTTMPERHSGQSNVMVTLRDGDTREYWISRKGRTVVGQTGLGEYQIGMDRIREITNVLESCRSPGE